MPSKYGFTTTDEGKSMREKLLAWGEKEASRINKTVQAILADLKSAKQLEGNVSGGPCSNIPNKFGEWFIDQIQAHYSDKPYAVFVSFGYDTTYQYIFLSVGGGDHPRIDSKTIATLENVISSETGIPIGLTLYTDDQ